MHWRRGHYRRLNRGTPELIPIPPCLVNAGDGVGEDMLPSAKDYVMPAPPGFMLRE